MTRTPKKKPEVMLRCGKCHSAYFEGPIIYIKFTSISFFFRSDGYERYPYQIKFKTWYTYIYIYICKFIRVVIKQYSQIYYRQLDTKISTLYTHSCIYKLFNLSK